MSRLKITSVRQGLGFTQRGSVYVLPNMSIACDISRLPVKNVLGLNKFVLTAKLSPV